MSARKSIQLILAAVLVVLSALCAQANNMSDENAQLQRTLQRKALQLYQTYMSQSQQLPTVRALWQLSNTKTFSRRKVAVRIAWGKSWQVQTACQGIEKNGKLYVASSCYYPFKKEKQDVKWLGTKVWVNGTELKLDEPAKTDSGWVVFDVSDRSAETNR